MIELDRVTCLGSWDDCEAELFTEINDPIRFRLIKQRLSDGTYELWNSAGSYLVTHCYYDLLDNLILEIVAGTAHNSKQAIFNLKEIAEKISAKLIARAERRGLAYLYQKAGFIIKNLSPNEWLAVYNPI